MCLLLLFYNMKFLIVCVNYNSLPQLESYLVSINAAVNAEPSTDLKVVVVDNSKENSKIDTSCFSYSIDYLYKGKNLGYLGAAECGIKSESECLDQYDYIAISNVDLQLDKFFFVRLSELNITNKQIGCIAPQILSKYENADRNPKIIYRPSHKNMRRLKLMYRYPLLHYLYTNIFYQLRRKHKMKFTGDYIYASHGSFLLFTNSFSFFLKTFSFPSFMFGEEIFFAENLRELSLKTLYCRSLVVYDSDHVSTKNLKRKQYYEWNYQSLSKLTSMYFNE